MRIPYLETLKRFPMSWGKFNVDMLGKSRYSLIDNNTVSAVFNDKSVYPHYNHVEMSGFETSTIISYLVDSDRRLKLRVFGVFPQLRVNKNLTHDSLTRAFKHVTLSVKGDFEKVNKIEFDGKLRIYTSLGGLDIKHTFFAAVDKKAVIHKVDIVNLSSSDIAFAIINSQPNIKISPMYTASKSAYHLSVKVLDKSGIIPGKAIKQTIASKSSKNYCIAYAYDTMTYEESQRQDELRQSFIKDGKNRLIINTPDKNINALLEFCKLRATESIFNTKKGLMHSPGGGGYYAALWTNDQCEYANPLFAYMGYDRAVEQSENCYKLFSKFASQDEAIYSSIISCGDGTWHGVGDRGDSSMFLYGLSRFLLSRGDKALTMKFMDSIEKALVYVKSKFNADNVVESDSDELENRFESGKANLSTAIITYDALQSLIYLFDELGYKQKSVDVEKLLYRLSQGIDSYFADTVEGYETYRYCKEESNLRSWICLPLTVGITSRMRGTVDAIMSDSLRMKNGILTRSGEKTYWDRSTLYALRGMFYVGAVKEGYDLLNSYSKERLLGEHVPYPVEAFPEGNAAHLSAESALYIRIFTEGIIGYRPTGFNSFEIRPNLPNEWSFIEVKAMELFGNNVDISIARDADNYKVTVNGVEFAVKKAIVITIIEGAISGDNIN